MGKWILYLVLWMCSLIMCSEQLFALEDDQLKIEALLVEINRAVAAKDYSKFKSFLIIGGYDSKLTLKKWEQMVSDPKKRNVLLHKYPLSGKKIKFLKVRRQGDRLIYFCETDLENENVQTVKALSFQKLDGAWKHYGRARSVSRARIGSGASKRGIPTWQNSGGIAHAIDTDPKFQYDHMFRPFTK